MYLNRNLLGTNGLESPRLFLRRYSFHVNSTCFFVGFVLLNFIGMTEKANLYYELFINWTNQKIKETFVQRNMFDFKHIKPLGHNNQEIDRPGPMVLFATPGMLHAGNVLPAF